MSTKETIGCILLGAGILFLLFSAFNIILYIVDNHTIIDGILRVECQVKDLVIALVSGITGVLGLSLLR